MGFKVKRTVEVQGTGTLQEFYVRVDKYTVYKNRSCMTILTGHFTYLYRCTNAGRLLDIATLKTNLKTIENR